MPSLRHIAIAVSDPWKSAEFYEKAFGMRRVTEARASIGDAVFLTDGVMNLSLCRYNADEPAGKVGKDYVGLHHIGFWVEDIDKTQADIEAAGGTFWMGEVPEDRARNVFYEVKYHDIDGVVVDITHTGWQGAKAPEDE
ncbi:VOC family protein [Gynuella sunshinyii]|uniref:Lactoylglutathione lyase and related lyase n=1 Tax=Gynuella sunshinyii YC6258 TaxID=1445510 RepID=A0A0C5V2B7_9GAMM|nr:VOC family protein [Gynuella sunshinyii]AJQ93650.1 lactoylglutathione lyase and related lyase [Gynuella sunshinyii YC6258]